MSSLFHLAIRLVCGNVLACAECQPAEAGRAHTKPISSLHSHSGPAFMDPKCQPRQQARRRTCPRKRRPPTAPQ